MTIYNHTDHLLEELKTFCQNHHVTYEDIKHEIIRGSNKTLGMTGLKHTEESKKLISNSLIGNTRSKGCVQSQESNKRRSIKLKGRKFTDEHRKRISESNMGKIVSHETLQKNIHSNCKNNLYFEIMSPDGVIYRSNNKRGFCKEHGLQPHNLSYVLNGLYKQHKGWTRP